MDPILLKESFHMIAPQKELFAQHFYRKLFHQYPQIRLLFSPTEEGMRRQEASLVATLAVVIAGIERGDNLTEVIYALGARHRKYGAQTAHYPIIGTFLIQSFHDLLGDAFTPQMENAWSQAYEIISAEMLEGAEQQSHGALDTSTEPTMCQKRSLHPFHKIRLIPYEHRSSAKKSEVNVTKDRCREFE